MQIRINDQLVECQEGDTILTAAKRADIFIPTLCAYLPLNHTPGTCRVCLVEIVHPVTGEATVVTSCNTPVSDGLIVQTRTARVRKMQRQQVAWLFADHNQDCASCVRHGNCELQTVAMYTGLINNSCSGRFTAKRPIDTSSPSLFREANKCIRCGRCVEVCRTIQGLGCLTMDNIGTECGVGIAGADQWADSTKCVNCGQCTLVCPTGALGLKNQTETAIEWMEDPEITTVVAFAPAVRVTMGDYFRLPPGTDVEKRIVTALKHIGADYVCDINWAADVTIMEEGTELLHRLEEGGTLPMMTSCCPGWVNFVEKIHPELIAHLSTTRSPQAIFGALAKTWFAREHGIDPKKLRFISIMPCTAKKDEAQRDQLARDGMPDTDLVLTVREFGDLLRRNGVHLGHLPDGEFDSPFMTQNTGASVIFGVTGGVMEAAVRTVYAVLTGKELAPIEFQPVRGQDWVKEATVDLGDKGTIKLAVVHTLAHAEKLCQLVKQGKADYHFVEVMACPGGCINGGGTVRRKNRYMEFNEQRAAAIYAIDEKRPLRQSHKNPDVVRLYEEFLGEPCGHASHDLLHTHYKMRKRNPKPQSITDIWKKVQLG
ncbi:MAG: iron hydrogenase small subunit [Duodenibacillus sp.]|nr:iron hydrogenase small subunit [Duodenibacillus sp.]